MSRTWETIYALERNSESDEAREPLEVAYWEAERATDEARRRECDAVAYQVAYEGEEVIARFSNAPARAERQREAVEKLEEIEALRKRHATGGEEGQAAEQTEAQARAQVDSVEVESGWRILAPWEDPHEGNMQARRYRLCLPTEHAQVQIVGPVGDIDEPLDVQVTDADGGHAEPVAEAGRWSEAITWLAARMGAD